MRRLAATALSLVVAGACSSSTHRRTTPATSGALAVAPAAITSPPPWPAPRQGVSALVAQAQLPLLPQEGLAEHIHAHLDVFYDGQRVTVPGEIGIDRQVGGISPLHTHDATGIVHIESAEKASFYLGQFFIEWGVQMAGGCVAGQCPPARPVSVYVNGALVPTPPGQVELTAHAEIALVVGPPPDPIPSSYAFPGTY